MAKGGLFMVYLWSIYRMYGSRRCPGEWSCTEKCPGDSWDKMWLRIWVCHSEICGSIEAAVLKKLGKDTRGGLLLLPGTEEWWAYWYLRVEKEVHFSVRRNPGKSSPLLWSKLFSITSETVNILWRVKVTSEVLTSFSLKLVKIKWFGWT